MKTFVETTDWDWPNHVYMLSNSKDKMYAYVKAGSNEIFEFKKPIKFNAGGRKFKEVNNTWGYFPPEDLKVVGKTWEVKGSKGDVYTVTEDASGLRTCSCTGFKFRGACKHIA